jgi:hypothetical protein
MNQQSLIHSLCGFIFFLLVSSACKKVDFHDPAQKCRIIETSDRIITYDEWGNPKLAVYKEDPDATGHPTFYFLYNSKHQLIAYGGGSQHYLTLNAAGQAIKDTLIMNYAGQDDRQASEISYDFFGRVRRITTESYHSGGEDLPLPHFKSMAEFKYDKRGNLIVQGFDTHGNPLIREYDHRTNIYRTHPVFMFVHFNYSINNLTPDFATYHYNAAGLPDQFEGDFLEGGGFESQIIYDCDNSNGK